MREGTEMISIFPMRSFMAGEVGFSFEGLLAVREFALKKRGMLVEMISGRNVVSAMSSQVDKVLDGEISR
jgi:hypothetical protein